MTPGIRTDPSNGVLTITLVRPQPPEPQPFKGAT